MKTHFVKKSRKEQKCTKCGKAIAVGSSYLWWQHRNMPYTVWCNEHGHPRPSQLTMSDKLSRLYAAGEGIEDAAGSVSGASDRDSLDSALQEIISVMESAAEDVRAVGEEYGESADNMEQAFPSGSSVIDEIREKAEGCETWADALDEAVSTLNGISLDDYQCYECNGTGYKPNETSDEDEAEDVECSECGGTGYKLEEAVQEIEDAVQQAQDEMTSF